MTLDLGPDELLTTTRAVRKRLDLGRPVERSVLVECVEMAVQAPTGSNRQGWQFLFVEDPDRKAALAELYGRSFDAYVSASAFEYPPEDPRGQRMLPVLESATYLREHLHEVPTLLVPCAEGRIPENGVPVMIQASYWGSLLPAVWSFMLAARARQLGTAWTTLHLAFEREAAGILEIPYDSFTQGGLVPVGYYKGTNFKPASRLPVEDLVHWDQW
jgi:nitroreductase